VGKNETNQIAGRIAEFLADFPPFDKIPVAALSGLAGKVVVKYLEKGTILFQEGQSPDPWFYVVRKGSIRIYSDESGQLIDLCDEGDVFGVRALLANDQYLASARAEEDSLLYALPVSSGREMLTSYPEIALWFASGFASGKPQPKTPFRIARPALEPDSSMVGMAKFEERKAIVSCAPNATIREAALAMTAAKVGSIIIADNEGRPLGIITDKDFRNKVVTGLKSIHDVVTDIMSSPVKTMMPGLRFNDYLLAMLQHQVHHLCITEDGTPATAAIGMVSEHDMLLNQGNSPAVLFREIPLLSTIEALAGLRKRINALLEQHIKQDAPIGMVMRMATTANDQFSRRLIDIAIAEMGRPPCAFCWLALGSHGRSEQIVQTDQDHALVFDTRGHQGYFLKLAKRVSDMLEAIGYPRDPAGISAENPRWCLALPDWKQHFTNWMLTPEPKAVLHATIFFDFRIVFGQEAIAESLRTHLNKMLPEVSLFYAYLAKDALGTPAPLSFFRNLVLERGGTHKNAFDLKLRVQLPLADCARVLALSQGISETNTAMRYRLLAQSDLANADLFIGAADAVEYVIRLRAAFGFVNQNDGRYIDPEALNKAQRSSLRNIFETISDLQQVVSVRFQTAMLR
jgi:CBS domain-containing protein